MRNHVFYKHTNIVIKKWGEKIRKKFSKNTRLGYPKIVGKNRLEKVRKHVFYKHTKIVTKNWGEKTREKIFSRNTRISRAKNDGKKIVWKKCENAFFL